MLKSAFGGTTETVYRNIIRLTMLARTSMVVVLLILRGSGQLVLLPSGTRRFLIITIRPTVVLVFVVTPRRLFGKLQLTLDVVYTSAQVDPTLPSWFATTDQLGNLLDESPM
jgi:hypothetical protein